MNNPGGVLLMYHPSSIKDKKNTRYQRIKVGITIA